jgi:hypothetical protein
MLFHFEFCYSAEVGNTARVNCQDDIQNKKFVNNCTKMNLQTLFQDFNPR